VKTRIAAGEVIETSTPVETKHAMREVVSEWFQEQARGVQPWRFISQPVTVAGGKIQLPATTDNEAGPNNGFCVQVRTIRIKGLASGDVLKVFRNSPNGEQVDEGVMPATGTLLVLKESKGLFLNSGEQLVFTGSSLTATGDITVSVEGSEVPAPDAYKLLT
jgi:hypothetical protein